MPYYEQNAVLQKLGLTLKPELDNVSKLFYLMFIVHTNHNNSRQWFY